jgi:Meckelin (Transmembrane protein 67)
LAAQGKLHSPLLPIDDLQGVRVMLVCALVAQGLALLIIIHRQVVCDVFFLDWEQPRRVVARGGAREEPAPVSCWRTIFVANEWNKFQTLRMADPAVTLVFLVGPRLTSDALNLIEHRGFPL